ncbi:hypothetical protein TWF730_003721 [Orbilia blumenaviensis]|uniref:Uncharacterized protein n=1 Tax=Orbilia blumenaviensis TaxID=1796055 RepID=A0AAV9U367_9PEZI
MCKTHKGIFCCKHQVVDNTKQCQKPHQCKNALKVQYNIAEKCSRCKYGENDVERDKAAMKKRRVVFMSHQHFETEDGPRECEIEVVPCTGGMSTNLGLTKKKEKRAQEAERAPNKASSSTGPTGRPSRGGSSSRGSSANEAQDNGNCALT